MQKTTGKPIKEEKISVAEALKNREFVGRKGTPEEKQTHDRLMAAMPKVEEALRSKLGDEFLGMSVFGSQYKGNAARIYVGSGVYAGSDVDIGVFVKHKDPSQRESLQKLVKETLSDANPEGGVRIDLNYEGLDAAKGCINLVKKAVDGSIKPVTTITDEGRYRYDILEVAGYYVLTFFDGKFFGGRIEEARKELITELARSPCGDLIWEKARELRDSHEKRDKYRMLTDAEFEELRKARRAELPSLKEMEEKYGVNLKNSTKSE